MPIAAVLYAISVAIAVVFGAAASAGQASAHTTAHTAAQSAGGFHATVSAVDPATRAGMIGVSWRTGCPVAIEDLRIIRMSYWGFDGAVHPDGELMVNKDVADQLTAAFRTMFNARFPIGQMQLIEHYGGSDDASMAADNSSAFNCRPVTGGGSFSVHSYGRAIDINTIENPYMKGSIVLPVAGAKFLDRADVRPGMIVAGDPTVAAFAAIGFDWGGSWTSPRDCQHFEAPAG